MARMPMQIPQPFNVNVQNSPLRIAPQQPSASGNYAASQSQLQYAPAKLYHYQNWSAAAGVGALSYTFFGASVGNNGVTAEDTNLLQPNNVGSGNRFLVTGIYVDLLLGQSYFSSGAVATEVTAEAFNDYKAIMNRGVFQMFVNNVPQIGNGIGPLKYMASPTMVVGPAAVSTGTGDATTIAFAAPYTMHSGYSCDWDRFAFDDQTPFSATVTFPAGAVTLPSANNTTKIGVVLDGFWFRPAG